VGSGQGSLLWGQGGDDELRGQGGNDVALFSKPVDADMTQGRAIGEGTDKLVGLGGLVGSSGNDKLTGDANANVLAGGTGGSDVISGAGGADVLVSGGPSTLLGGPGADELLGGGASDTLDGGTGDDLLSGGGGDDTIDGGAGTADAVSYLFSTSAVRVDLQQGTATGEGTDKLAGIENAAGSSHDDELIGDAGANALSGNDGNDRISGGAGSDFLDGGIGSNVLSGGPGVDYCRQKVRGCEISGAPNLPGKAPLPPGISATPTLAFSRAREPAPAVAYPVPEFALALAAEHLRPLMTARANRGETAAFEYAAEPICFAAKKPYSTEIAPPRTVSPIASDRKPEEAWWQGTLYRATGARYKKFKTTPWARADLAGGATVPGVTLWKDETGKRAFPSAVLLNVKRGRYVWKGNIYWVRSYGEVF